ncbi:MAG: diacylglycerol kinase [Opitutales bacterium]|nr:diacylglycerol kinase [Opitutales bacterium]
MHLSTDPLLKSGKPSNNRGVMRVIRATGYSLEGIGSALKHEAAFRQEFLLACLLVPVALLLPVGLLGKALLVAAVFLVLIVELLNSAVEWVVDYISTERHPFAKRAKDMGSAAVLLSLVHCGIVWGLVIAHDWERVAAMW